MNTTTTAPALPDHVARFNAAESDVEAAYQLGSRQRATWAKLTDAQRREANVLMATEFVPAGVALKRVAG